MDETDDVVLCKVVVASCCLEDLQCFSISILVVV